MHKFNTKERAFFAKRLSFLIKAGIPILESLKILKNQTKSKNKKKIFNEIINGVAGGQYLSTSLGKFKKQFGEFTISLIRVGETSGVLSENLHHLSEELKKRRALEKKIVGALIYPFFIATTTIVVTLFLTLYIFPKIMPIFKSLNVKLPLSTKIIIFTSNTLLHFGALILIVMILFIFSIYMLIKKSEKFQYILNYSIFFVPFFGKILKYYNLSNICRNLGIILKSGSTVIEALSITSATTKNLVYKKELETMQNEITRGGRLENTIEKNLKLFPDAHEIIAIGESSGSLPDTLIYLSEFYENEIDDATKQLSGAIEPILMIIMGASVGFIAISIITPIYEITKNLHP